MPDHPRNIRVHLDGPVERSHDIVFGTLDELSERMSEAGLASDRCVVVTDANVGHLYGERLETGLRNAGWECLLVTLPPGERTKSLDRLSEILDAALEFGVERRSPVVALGGGVIGDVAGFAAATILRGVPLVQVPTSLLAQVDSAIGGKTGVNHPVGKNLIGAFYQPSLVLMDVATLSTLSESEWLGGLSEVVKYALIRDEQLLETLLHSWDAILAREPKVTADIVARCASIKVEIVEEDEHESGIRAILNFGHTFGHALERIAGYIGITHGTAVAVGMRAAIDLSQRRESGTDFTRALDLTDRLPKPRLGPEITVDRLVDAMWSDKKRIGDILRFVLLEREGSAVVVDNVSEDEIRKSWEYAIGPLKSGHRSTDL
jgi:3-dehydroquinate synthase